MSGAPYDPSDPQTWPEEQLRLAMQAVHAILDKNLQPLADYLRAGHQLTPMLAGVIADAIEGKNIPVRIKVTADRPGRKKWSEAELEHRRSMQIGVFMEVRIRDIGKGGYEAALEEACTEFSITKSAVKGHHKYAREQLGSRDEWGYEFLLNMFEQAYLLGSAPSWATR